MSTVQILTTQINYRGAMVEENTYRKVGTVIFLHKRQFKIIPLYVYYITFICKTTLLPLEQHLIMLNVLKIQGIF